MGKTSFAVTLGVLLLGFAPAARADSSSYNGLVELQTAFAHIAQAATNPLDVNAAKSYQSLYIAQYFASLANNDLDPNAGIYALYAYYYAYQGAYFAYLSYGSVGQYMSSTEALYAYYHAVLGEFHEWDRATSGSPG